MPQLVRVVREGNLSSGALGETAEVIRVSLASVLLVVLESIGNFSENEG